MFQIVSHSWSTGEEKRQKTLSVIISVWPISAAMDKARTKWKLQLKPIGSRISTRDFFFFFNVKVLFSYVSRTAAKKPINKLSRKKWWHIKCFLVQSTNHQDSKVLSLCSMFVQSFAQRHSSPQHYDNFFFLCEDIRKIWNHPVCVLYYSFESRSSNDTIEKHKKLSAVNSEGQFVHSKIKKGGKTKDPNKNLLCICCSLTRGWRESEWRWAAQTSMQQCIGVGGVVSKGDDWNGAPPEESLP